MSHDTKPDPKQKTPKGYQIPVPTEREVEDALDKVAKKPLPPRRGPKKQRLK